MADDLFTIKEIAKQLGLPESNIRYYRDKFEEFLPFVGQGRKRRYRPQALEIFSYISQCLKKSMSSEEIAENLNKRAFMSHHEPSYHDQPAASAKTDNSSQENLSALIQSQAKTLEELSSTLKKYTENSISVQQVQDDLSTFHHKLSDFETALDDFENKQSVPQDLPQDIVSKFDYFDSMLNGLGKEVQDLEQIIKKQDTTTLKEQLDQTASTLETLGADFKTLRDKVEAMEESEPEPNTQLADDIAVLKTKVESLQDTSPDSIDKGKLKKAFESLRNEIKNIKQKNEELEEALQAGVSSEQNEDLALMRTTMDQLSGDIISLTTRMDEVAPSSSTEHSAEDVDEDSKATIVRMESELQSLTSQTTDLSEQISSIQSGDSNYLRDNFSQLGKEMASMSTAIAEMEKKVEEISAAQTQENGYVGTQFTGINDQMSEIHQKVEDLEQRILLGIEPESQGRDTGYVGSEYSEYAAAEDVENMKGQLLQVSDRLDTEIQKIKDTGFVGSGVAKSVDIEEFNEFMDRMNTMEQRLNAEIRDLQQARFDRAGGNASEEPPQSAVESLQKQITILEEQMRSYSGQTAEAPSVAPVVDTSALEARIDALEDKFSTKIKEIGKHLKTCWTGVQKISKVVSSLSGKKDKGKASDEPAPEQSSKEIPSQLEIEQPTETAQTPPQEANQDDTLAAGPEQTLDETSFELEPPSSPAPSGEADSPIEDTIDPVLEPEFEVASEETSEPTLEPEPEPTLEEIAEEIPTLDHDVIEAQTQTVEEVADVSMEELLDSVTTEEEIE